MNAFAIKRGLPAHDSILLGSAMYIGSEHNLRSYHIIYLTDKIVVQVFVFVRALITSS